MFYPLGVAILCDQKLKVPNGRPSLNPIPQLLTPYNAYTHMKVDSGARLKYCSLFFLKTMHPHLKKTLEHHISYLIRLHHKHTLSHHKLARPVAK